MKGTVSKEFGYVRPQTHNHHRPKTKVIAGASPNVPKGKCANTVTLKRQGQTKGTIPYRMLGQ